MILEDLVYKYYLAVKEVEKCPMLLLSSEITEEAEKIMSDMYTARFNMFQHIGLTLEI